MKTILITGFENFSGLRNPTQDIVTDLNKHIFPEYSTEIIGVTLPVDWRQTWKKYEAFMKDIRKNNTEISAIVNFGLFEGIGEFYIENSCYNMGSIDGHYKVIDSDPLGFERFATLPIDYLLNKFKEPTTRSVLPARRNYLVKDRDCCFICNQTFYNTMSHFEDIQHRGFVHVPDAGNYSFDTRDQNSKYQKIKSTALFLLEQIVQYNNELKVDHLATIRSQENFLIHN